MERVINGGLMAYTQYPAMKTPDGDRFTLPVADYDDDKICRSVSEITVDVSFTDANDLALCEQEFREAVEKSIS